MEQSSRRCGASSPGSSVRLRGSRWWLSRTVRAGGREALRRLRAIVGRMESSWRPASAEESFEIVRRRLFQPVDASRLAARDASCLAFGEFYRGNAAEFPVECREPAYVERLKAA